MRRFILRALLFMSALCHIASADIGNAPPSGDQLIDYINQHVMRESFELTDFRVRNVKHWESGTNPVWETKFTATMIVTKNLYVTDDVVGDIRFLNLQTPEGKTYNLRGTARSFVVDEQWQHRVGFSGHSFPIFGRPRASFSKKTVVRGSDEEKELPQVDRAHALATFAQNPTLAGKATYAVDPPRVWPFELAIVTVDQETGEWTGTIAWQNLGALHRVEGTVSGAGITFTQTEVIIPGDAALGCIFTLTFGNRPIRVSGMWNCAKHNARGEAWLDFTE